MRKRSRRWILGSTIATIALLCMAALAFFAYRRWTDREPNFHGAFSGNWNGQLHQGGWQPFGGTWQVVDGAMQNISDDRGAKLMYGSPHSHNYIVEADIKLLGESGDAGILVRSSDEEVGVDSYHGYFAGLRNIDETLILGRADYGWHEFQTIPIHSGVHSRTWYHLKFLAYECNMVAIATSPNGEMTKAILREPSCLATGRFGLQSYSTGAVWKNFDVRPATQQDLETMLSVQGGTAPEYREYGRGTPELWSDQRLIEPMLRDLRNHTTDPDAIPIANLRLLAPNQPSHVTVDGVVTLVSPILFVQDSTGGVAIPNAPANTPVQIGDAVEVRGDSEQHNFSSVLRSPDIRRLWSHTSVPPVSVTPAQAATGAFDAQYIETEGRLREERHIGKRSIELKLSEGSQSFLAIADSPSLAENLSSLKTGSRLRMRGICVTDRTFARNETSFALLMRSVDDAQVIESPPWWNPQHTIELFIALLALSFGVQLIYISVKRSQSRAITEERERLALEMHDTLAQSYAGLGFQLEALCSEAVPDTRMRTRLESIVSMVRAGHLEARRNIAALRPSNLEQMGLARALEYAAHAVVQGGSITVSMSVRGEPRQLPLRIGDTLYRIGQEAIANAVRHGHPRNIEIRLVYGRPSVRLTIRDDGQGFSIQEEASGFGISGMLRRSESINANLRIHSSPGHGTSVHVRVVPTQAPLTSWWQPIVYSAIWKRGQHGKRL
jgi:signal transduction histidine kinase